MSDKRYYTILNRPRSQGACIMDLVFIRGIWRVQLIFYQDPGLLNDEGQKVITLGTGSTELEALDAARHFLNDLDMAVTAFGAERES